jgi:TRAP-type C4-dicarboxylate transport system permease small subunit
VLKFNKGLDWVLSAVTSVVLIVMMFHVVANAILRHFFDQPIYGTNEVVAYWYLPAVVLLGIPAAQLRNEQITVTLVVDHINRKAALVFTVFASVLGVLMSLGFAWFGLHEAMEKMSIGATAGVIDVIAWPVYFLVPIVFVLLAVLFLIDIAMTARTGEPEVDLISGKKVEHDIEEPIV